MICEHCRGLNINLAALPNDVMSGPQLKLSDIRAQYGQCPHCKVSRHKRSAVMEHELVEFSAAKGSDDGMNMRHPQPPFVREAFIELAEVYDRFYWRAYASRVAVLAREGKCKP